MIKIVQTYIPSSFCKLYSVYVFYVTGVDRGRVNYPNLKNKFYDDKREKRDGRVF